MLFTGNVNCYLRENQKRSDEVYIASGSGSSINPVYIDESVFDPTIEDVAEPENENRRGRQKLNIRGGYCWGKPFSAESDEKALKACFGLEKAEATEVGKGTSAHVYKFKDNSDLNDVFRDYQHDPLTPVLKTIITQALCIEPDARPTIEFAKKLLEK